MKSTSTTVDERVQNSTFMLVPGLLHHVTNYNSMYCLFISPINTQYSNGHYGWMITILIFINHMTIQNSKPRIESVLN